MVIGAASLWFITNDPMEEAIRSGLYGDVSGDGPKGPVEKRLKGLPPEAATKDVSETEVRLAAQRLRDALKALKDKVSEASPDDRRRNRQFDEEIRLLETANNSEGSPKLIYGPDGTLRSVAGSFSLPGVGETAEEVSDFISSYPAIFGLTELEEPVVTRHQSTTFGSVYHVDRKLEEWPVWGRQWIVSESEGRVNSVSGNIQPLPDLDTRADLTELAGLQIAQAGITDWQGQRTEYQAEQGIYVEGQKAHFVYRFVIASDANKAWVVYVSMNSQRVLAVMPKHYDATNSQGVDLLGVTHNFSSELSSDGSRYVLKDTTFPLETSGTGVGYDDPVSEDNFYVTSSDPLSGWRPSAISAIANARKTYDYFYEVHGRNSFNANNTNEVPQPLLAIVDALDEDGSGLDNAYWYGGTMYYGQGSALNNLAVALDVSAHEFGHGVVEYTAGLRYHNQSGALNESFADFFGAMVDRDDWLIGENLFNEGQALRDMANPERGNQPASFDDFEHLPDTKDGDWGGVHINSGIQNRAFYLLAEGLSKEGLGTSIGKEKTEQIAYQALLRLGEDAEFIDAFIQMKQMAAQLYGDDVMSEVEAAWGAVGIGVATVPESNNQTVEFTLPSGTDVVSYLYPQDGTFDYDESDVYELYAYYSSDLSTSVDYVSDQDRGPVNDFPAALIKPALFSLTLDDGSFIEVAIYVSAEGKLVLADVPNLTDDSVVDSDLSINSVSVSPDGGLLAIVLADERLIAVIDLNSEDGSTEVFEVLGPNYSSDETASPVERVDATSFDHTGTKLIFDFLSCRPNLDGSDCIPFWSIGILDPVSGGFDYPFPGQDEFIDLGYPEFSNVDNDIFVFDFLDYRNSESVDSLVLSYNQSEDVFSFLGTPDPDSIHGGIFSLPTFRGADQTVLFQYYYLGPEEGSVPQDILFSARIDAGYEYVENGSGFLFDFGSGYAKAHRSGSQAVVADLSFSKQEIQLGDVSGEQFVSEVISFRNTGARDIEINSVAPDEGLQTNLTNTVVSAGQTVTFTVGLKPNQFSEGALTKLVVISHDGDSRGQTLSISANVVGSDLLSGGTSGGADGGGADGSTSGGGSSDGSSTGGGSSGGGSSSNEELVNGFDWDIDNDGSARALTDGLLVIRYLFGFSGDALVADAVGESAKLIDSSEIQSYLSAVEEASILDIDGNGDADALTDGLLLIRGLFGFSGDALIVGAVGDSAQRSSATAISAYISERLSSSGSGGASDGSGDSGTGTGGTDNGSGASKEIEVNLVYDRVPYCQSSECGSGLDYERTVQQPMRFVLVDVLSGSGTEVLQQGLVSDAEGQLSFSIDSDASFSLRIRAESRGAVPGQWGLRVVNNQGSTEVANYPVYAIESTLFKASDVLGPINLGAGSGWTEADGYSAPRAAGPFAIIDSMILATEYALSGRGTLVFEPIDVYWSEANTEAAVGTSFFGGAYIMILGDADVDTDEYDESVVIHEWGHYFQHVLSRDDSLGGAHGSGDLLDMRVAFSEGWANAFSGLASDREIYQDSRGASQSQGFSLPLEQELTLADGAVKGWYSEGSVQNFIFDLFDSPEKDDDMLALSTSAMINAMVDFMPQQSALTSIFSFTEGLLQISTANTSGILSLLNAQDIASGTSSVDMFGLGETNSGQEYTTKPGVSDVTLPVYMELDERLTTPDVCQDVFFGGSNKLGVYRFIRFSLAVSGNYQITATTSQAPAGAVADPDFYVYSSSVYRPAESADENIESLRLNLEAGDYTMAVTDYNNNENNAGNAIAGQYCQEVEVLQL